MASSGFKVNAGFPPAAKLTIIVSPIALEIDNIKEALNQDNQTWQRIGVALGWDQWSLGIETKY